MGHSACREVPREPLAMKEMDMKTLDKLAREDRTEALDTLASAQTNLWPSEDVEIIDYEAQYKEVFKQLNLEWIEHYFSVEEIDNAMLSDPEKYFLQPGGYIFFAKYCGEIVGTCALLKHPEQGFELSKMGVTRYHRGMGIGKTLVATAIQKVRSLGEKRLFLETNSKLLRAIFLYKKFGFRERAFPHERSLRYKRADTYMVLEL
jgi:GNAT superfamily N-acetyltransferase